MLLAPDEVCHGPSVMGPVELRASGRAVTGDDVSGLMDWTASRFQFGAPPGAGLVADTVEV
jgi:hypothetical protein